MSNTPGSKKGWSPTFMVILIILGLAVAFALYLILNAEHIKLTGLSSVMRGFANHPAPGKAGIASLLAIEHHLPGLPEPVR